MEMENNQTQPTDLSRRNFLKTTGASLAGLSVALYIPDSMAKAAAKLTGQSIGYRPNAFVHITSDNKITLYMKHLEMGQGIYTGLSSILAEELDVSLEQVIVEAAPSDPSRYNNLFWGPMQGTGGSTGIANSYDQLRNAGAKVRTVMLEAGAKKWKTKTKNLSVKEGVVYFQAKNKKASYGELVDIAKGLPVPKKVIFKAAKDYQIVGNANAKRVDARAKVNGTAQFGLDIRRPNRATAVIARSPKFGGLVKSFDASKAKKMKGVLGVYQVPMGIAVVAEDFWTASKAREALSIQWDNSKAMKKSSEEILADYKKMTKKAGTKVARFGRPAKEELKKADRVIKASYTVPYLAHTPLEPLSCTAEFTKDGGVELWTGSQIQTMDQGTAAKILGLSAEKVKLNTTLAGGSFGRRATPTSDIVAEASFVLKAAKELKRPIHTVRSREDDLRGGFYRPIYVHDVQVGLDKDGKAMAWEHKVVGQSIVAGTAFAGLIKDGIDKTSVEGVDEMIYGVPNFNVELHTTKQDVSVLWWRSVGHTHTAFVMETLIDELAEAEKKDPADYRLERLGSQKRHINVLKEVMKISNWKKRKKTRGKGFGIAVHKSFASYVAQVVEVTIDKTEIKVDKVYCAVDCGLVINPEIVKTQMEGGIGFAISSALFENLEIKNGEPVHSNFDGYELLTFDRMPEVEVSMIKSTEKPTGVGEPGVPPIYPALANAIADATGKRLRDMPFKLDGSSLG